jgi:cytochrome bd-type quinol oxidase subunit 2
VQEGWPTPDLVFRTANVLALFGWLSLMILRHGETGNPFVDVAGLSLIAGSLLGGLTGIFISLHQSHWVGGVHTDASGLPIFGWSRTAGDLRVAHFFGMHIMQAVPIAMWLARFIIPRHRQKTAGLALLSAAILIAVGTFVQAVAGRPFMMLD